MRTLDLGRITVDRIVELDPYWIDPFYLFRNMEQEVLDRNAIPLGERLFNKALNRLAISYHSFLIRCGGLNILVDTCNGNHKERPGMPWVHQFKLDRYLSDLSKQGLTPDDIHVVMCTHLHVDHVGWNTKLDNGRWVPTFRNARYLFSKQEFEFHRERWKKATDKPYGYGSFDDSVLPVMEAGLVELVSNDHRVAHELDAGVCLEHSPGHTPGHICVSLSGESRRALITGDVIYHPIQFREPQLIAVGDFDEELAKRTRARIIERCAVETVTMLTCHFPDPTAGYVRRDGERFTFEFAQ
jgi:glyoxylase-like metal-dependent hydrolase (beta-lactamase superfamily II)